MEDMCKVYWTSLSIAVKNKNSAPPPPPRVAALQKLRAPESSAPGK